MDTGESHPAELRQPSIAFLLVLHFSPIFPGQRDMCLPDSRVRVDSITTSPLDLEPLLPLFQAVTEAALTYESQSISLFQTHVHILQMDVCTLFA